MTIVRYAAYGSNLHPVRLTHRVPTATLVLTTHVQGFGLRFHKRSVDGSGKGNIVAASDETIHLAVYELSTADRNALDAIEGLGNGYDRLDLTLPEIGRCYTYRASDSHRDDDLRPYAWYKSLVLAGCHYHGFPDPYVSGIDAVAHADDPDADRHRTNMGLVKRCRALAKCGQPTADHEILSPEPNDR